MWQNVKCDSQLFLISLYLWVILKYISSTRHKIWTYSPSSPLSAKNPAINYVLVSQRGRFLQYIVQRCFFDRKWTSIWNSSWNVIWIIISKYLAFYHLHYNCFLSGRLLYTTLAFLVYGLWVAQDLRRVLIWDVSLN